jgi:pimeloyl-ACP methyl ester carboxylesterase
MCTTQTNDPAKAELKSVDLNHLNTTIEYLDAGRGDTTLLFAHGWNINKSYWEEQIPFFSNKYRVIAIDLPGHGNSVSDRTDWTIEEYGRDITLFIEKLNLKQVVLIGHSMSGAVMLEVATANNPAVIGLVGVDNFKTVGLPESPEMKEQVQAFFSQLRSDYKTMAASYASDYLLSPETDSIVRARVIADYTNADREVAMANFASILDYSPNVASKLKKLTIPLMLIQSSGMPTYQPGLDSTCSAGYKILEISGVGHFPMIEKPRDFNRQLEQLLISV